MQEKYSLNDEKGYRKLSKTFRFYKFAALFLCIIFVLGGSVVFKDEISVENLRYLLKYLDLNASDITSQNAQISFDIADASGCTAGLYRNDLVLVDQNNFEVFDFHNGKVYNDTFSMTHPTLNTSSRYAMIYDLGGKQLRLYNSFSLLKEQTYDYPVFCADVNDHGRYAVATSEKNYHCAVYVYNASLQQVFKWLSADKYVSDIALNDDSSELLSIASVRADKGDFVSDLLLFRTDRSDQGRAWSFPGELPLKTFVDSSYVRLLTDHALHTVSIETGEITTVSFDREQLKKYYFSQDYSVIVLDDNTVGASQLALICDRAGQQVRSYNAPHTIQSLDCYEDQVFFFHSRQLCRLDVSGGECVTYDLEGEYTQFFATGPRSVVLVEPGGARVCVWDN